MELLGMGTLELLMVLLIALAIFGPQRLVDIARQLGRFVRAINRMGSEFTRTLSEENLPREDKETLQELKKLGSEVKQALSETAQDTTEAGQEVEQAMKDAIPVSWSADRAKAGAYKPPPPPETTTPPEPEKRKPA